MLPKSMYRSPSYYVQKAMRIQKVVYIAQKFGGIELLSFKDAINVHAGGELLPHEPRTG